MRKKIRGFDELTEEERKSYIDQPGTPWKTWWQTEGMKPWLGLALFILDAFTYLQLWEIGTLATTLAIPPAVFLSLYLDFVLWSYLWHVPTPREIRASHFKRSLLKPFLAGRWTMEYRLWKEGGMERLKDDQISPHEFI